MFFTLFKKVASLQKDGLVMDLCIGFILGFSHYLVQIFFSCVQCCCILWSKLMTLLFAAKVIRSLACWSRAVILIQYLHSGLHFRPLHRRNTLAQTSRPEAKGRLKHRLLHVHDSRLFDLWLRSKRGLPWTSTHDVWEELTFDTSMSSITSRAIDLGLFKIE